MDTISDDTSQQNGFPDMMSKCRGAGKGASSAGFTTNAKRPEGP
jgi:hypothetical protein